MKAILMLKEMPSTCLECHFHKVYADNKLEETYCELIDINNEKGTSTRYEYCPLVEINDNIAKLIEIAR